MKSNSSFVHFLGKATPTHWAGDDGHGWWHGQDVSEEDAGLDLLTF